MIKYRLIAINIGDIQAYITPVCINVCNQIVLAISNEDTI